MVLRLERADLDDYNDDEFSAYKLNQEMVENNNDSDADSIDEPWGEGDSAGESRDGGDGVFGTPEEFMATFFDHYDSTEFERLRKEDAAAFLPTVNDEFVSACLGMIDGAPRGKDNDER